MIISIFDNLHWYKHISHIFIYMVYQWYTINEWAIFHPYCTNGDLEIFRMWPGDQVRHRVDVARKSQGLHGAMLIKFSLNIDWRLIKYWLNDWILQEGKHFKNMLSISGKGVQFLLKLQWTVQKVPHYTAENSEIGSGVQIKPLSRLDGHDLWFPGVSPPISWSIFIVKYDIIWPAYLAYTLFFWDLSWFIHFT